MSGIWKCSDCGEEVIARFGEIFDHKCDPWVRCFCGILMEWKEKMGYVCPACGIVRVMEDDMEKKVEFTKYEKQRILDIVKGLRSLSVNIGHPERSGDYHLLKKLERWIKDGET